MGSWEEVEEAGAGTHGALVALVQYKLSLSPLALALALTLTLALALTLTLTLTLALTLTLTTHRALVALVHDHDDRVVVELPVVLDREARRVRVLLGEHAAARQRGKTHGQVEGPPGPRV